MQAFYDFVASRHGVFSRAEAIEFGLSTSGIDRRIATGQFRRVARGTYVTAGSPDTWLQRAAIAAIGSGGLVSHRAAAALHGIDGFAEGDIEVTVPKHRRPRGGDFIIKRTTQFGRTDATEVDGIPVTGLTRTVLDVAAVVGPRRLNQTIDAVLRQGLCEWEDLFHVWVIHSIQGRNGCGPLRTLLEARFGDKHIPDSRWNRMVADLLVDRGLAEPALEYEIRAGTQLVGRVDLAYPRERVAIELDSVRWHLNSESFVQDPRRKNRLMLSGWTVLTFTWSDYIDTPQNLVETVRLARLNAA